MERACVDCAHMCKWTYQAVDCVCFSPKDFSDLLLTTPEPEPTPAAPVVETYPDNNPKTILGLAKPSITCVPPSAMLHMGRAMVDGKKKYGLMNWREKTVSSSIYIDALWRHMSAWWDGEENAKDSGVHHLGHAMACCALILDAQSQGSLNDDRPIPGTFPELVKQFTQPTPPAVQ